MQRRLIRKCLEEILSVLNTDQIEYHPFWNNIYTHKDLEVLKKVILTHGIGPYLFQVIRSKFSGRESSSELFEWLSQLYETNTLRIQEIHADLETILIKANRVGIPLMLLKGSLLTTCHYSLPGIRPMADIDLLIKPNDYSGVKSILDTLGYDLIKSRTAYANHYGFIKRNNSQVVSRNTEHPDNPRPVEVHTELSRPFLGIHGAIDLTEFIWKDSFSIELFGMKAISPKLESMFTHLAVHASGHFFTQTGRVLHLLDLAILYTKIDHVIPTNMPDQVYYPLILASRTFTSKFADYNFSSQNSPIDPRISRWAAQIPLDDRCGLTINIHGSGKNKMQQRILRWKPLPWRLILAYGSMPLLLAYLRYTMTLLGRTKQLVK